ncbi:conserved hypothetical protein [Altererythrobacter sp. B11]|uniref:DUF4350 domain-containing protein n=1 Tax=Altererythrobacter sp. B11 TaxID=2060312 RepID=UPI000DC71A8E|nr:DUF4350 domain-containing protein [Altererythrobacter sp. B11]BBC74416.1 conserved hypothetical protein [Altererythrobacter sp. B11]
MSGGGSHFSRGAALALVVASAATLLFVLYAMGRGWDGNDGNNGGAHAAARGLNGFAGLADLLKRRGLQVTLSRSAAHLDDEALLILTPPHDSDGKELAELLQERRYVGPTLVILPKWLAAPPPPGATAEHPRGWVRLIGALAPTFTGDMKKLDMLDPAISAQRSWRGLGLAGTFPAPDAVQTVDDPDIIPLVSTGSGRTLAGYWDNGGFYPELAEAAGRPATEEDTDASAWPVVFVAEPDLMNNYGMADLQRAEAALQIVETTLEDYDLPVVFDLTLVGLGFAENPLTLAFRPPFLAATLCLALALLVIGWRAFRRFGAPVTPASALAMGKEQLARNGAALVQRTGRLHLLGPPYAAMLAARIGRALGIRESDPGLREAAIARTLAARGRDELDYAGHSEALRSARRPGDLLRAARALKVIERTVEE